MNAVLDAPARVETPEFDDAIGPEDFIGWRYANDDMIPLTEDDLLHPQEGDQVMNEKAHIDTNSYLVSVFEWSLAGKPGVIVFSDHGMDWEIPGLQVLSPDVTVVTGAEGWVPGEGAIFPVKTLGAGTVLVMELTSRWTRHKDIREKVELYGRAGVPHYVVVDLKPRRKHLDYEFIGYKHAGTGLIRYEHDPKSLWLPEVNLWLVARGRTIHCEQPDGTVVPDYTSLRNRAEAQSKRADTEAERVDALAAELAALKAKLTTPSTNGH